MRLFLCVRLLAANAGIGSGSFEVNVSAVKISTHPLRNKFNKQNGSQIRNGWLVCNVIWRLDCKLELPWCPSSPWRQPWNVPYPRGTPHRTNSKNVGKMDLMQKDENTAISCYIWRFWNALFSRTISLFWNFAGGDVADGAHAQRGDVSHAAGVDRESLENNKIHDKSVKN